MAKTKTAKTQIKENRDEEDREDRRKSKPKGTKPKSQGGHKHLGPLPTCSEMGTITVASIEPSPINPRRIDEQSERFKKLLASVQACGVVVPIHLRAMEAGMHYQIIAGERRWRAARIAGLNTIPALIYRGITDENAFRLTFIENHDRDDLTPVEEGRGVMTLLEMCNNDVRAVAAELAWSESRVRARARLSRLTETWQKLWDDEAPLSKSWGVGHLELIAALPAEVQEKLAKKATEQWGWASCTVAELESRLEREVHHLLRLAIWKLDDEFAGQACTKCSKRSSADLFGADVAAEDDRCLNPDCWNHHYNETIVQIGQALLKKYSALVFVHGDHAGEDVSEALKVLDVDDKLTLGSWEYELLTGRKAKANLNAQPALMLDGEQAGQLVWITTKTEANRDAEDEEDTEGTGKGSAPPREETPEEKAERKERLRRNVILENFQNAFKMTFEEIDKRISDTGRGSFAAFTTLLLTYGISGAVDLNDDEFFTALGIGDDDDVNELVIMTKLREQRDLHELLWQTIAKEFQHNPWFTPNERRMVDDDRLAEALAIAELLGVKID